MSDRINVTFANFFNVNPKVLEDYGAFNISLLSDLPLFIDPFLLFNSDKLEYRRLHDEIIKYLKFLREQSLGSRLDKGLISAWYRFGEVDQTWLGFTVGGNKGKGLGPKFARSLNKNFFRILPEYGEETITSGSHLEKLCLIEPGVGKDNISDFTTNLIKGFLAEYTESFAERYLKPEQCRRVSVSKSSFDYTRKVWKSEIYNLPFCRDDYVLLVPEDMLTRDEVWIDKDELFDGFDRIRMAFGNEELRSLLNNYLVEILGDGEHTRKEKKDAVQKVLRKYPEIIDYYIKDKEERGDQATRQSERKVDDSKQIFIEQFSKFPGMVYRNTGFYQLDGDSYEAVLQRAHFVKHVIEDCDGYRIFYHQDSPIGTEKYLQVLYSMTWYGSPVDYNTEVNNGRGPADGLASIGSKDKTLAEFKLASNPQLRRNLEHQTKIYEKAAGARRTIKMIIYFSQEELDKVMNILEELAMEDTQDLILIDARRDNKPSASQAKSH